ncbi:MAG: universal stress protein [Acidobacteria bacterium]|nr:universal stress protein [Acidobacteriota bacterium]
MKLRGANGAVEAAMIEIQRILCPVDFSEASRHALEHAVAVANWYESEVAALHVLTPAFVPQPPIFYTPPAPPSRQERRHAAETELRLWLDAARADAARSQVLLDDGQPATCILEHAGRLAAGLIVMGTHGLSGFDRLVLGSITEKVLRKAGCPVMTVPPAAATTAKVPYTRLLCPIDFSESSLHAFGLAVSLAEEADAHLTLLYVLERPSSDAPLADPFESAEYRRRSAEDARRRLEALVTSEMRVWCKPEIRVVEGKAYRKILDVAGESAIDLIVIGVRGRSAADLAIFGSTTNQVVRHAACPVLTRVA